MNSDFALLVVARLIPLLLQLVLFLFAIVWFIKNVRHHRQSSLWLLIGVATLPLNAVLAFGLQFLITRQLDTDSVTAAIALTQLITGCVGTFGLFSLVMAAVSDRHSPAVKQVESANGSIELATDRSDDPNPYRTPNSIS